jgi:hypothetical protein
MLASTTASPESDLRRGDGVAFPVAVDSERVDRVDRAAGREEGGDEQAAVGLDRDRDRLVGGVAVVGEQSEQGAVSGEVVSQRSLGHDPSGVVDERDVVVGLRPVDAAGDVHLFVCLHVCRDGWLSRRGHARDLLAGLKGPTSHQPFVTRRRRRPSSRSRAHGSRGTRHSDLRRGSAKKLSRRPRPA